jgi:hypothetical protein
MVDKDIWGAIWPNPYPEGKVHRSVVSGLSSKITLWTRFETILVMVMLSGISDDNDQIATARALRDKRDMWRKSYDPTRKAITA